MTSPFHVRKISNYGLNNPIVARLSFQVIDILKECNIKPTDLDKIQKIYVDQLMPQLLKMWEIENWYRDKFNEQVQKYELNVKNGNKAHLPYIPLLEEECHTFLHGYKNFMRNLLAVFNVLYKTEYKEVSEFYSRTKKKKSISLIEFAENNFGKNDPKTLFLKEAEKNIRTFIAMRNAIVHPDGHSGTFKISNFVICIDGIVEEPCWWREKPTEKEIEKFSIRVGFEVAIHDLLTLAESVLFSWVDEHLSLPAFKHLTSIPEEKRDPNRPVKYKIQYHLPYEIENDLPLENRSKN